MKKLAYLLIVTAISSISSQAFAQTSGGSSGNVNLPAVQAARDAFFASLNAYQMAQSEAYYWRSIQQYNPRFATAAYYWQVSANSQYQALLNLHSVWTDLEETGIVTPTLRNRVHEAEDQSLFATWNALAGASVTSSIYNRPAFMAAGDGYNKVELLVRKIDPLMI